MKKIFLIDDEIEMLNSLEKILSTREDLVITKDNNSESALLNIDENEYDLVITDLKMQGVSGLDIVKKVKEKLPNAKVIVVSGYGTIEASVEAIKHGAFDFIEKPFTSKKLFKCVDRALKSVKEAPVADHENINGIIFKSDKMKEVIVQAEKVAENDMNILITGESGSGKELIARAIHNISKGDTEPFVPVNCGALPEHLFESELFGHEKGAFTGALKTKPGLLEFANNGTFFFDEIGDMSQALQVKLLRMLEERKIRRVGGQKEIEINVRIIAATNQNLEKLVKENRFRQDLYYRLNTFTLEIPPLRERKEDILPLVFDFMEELCRKDSKIIREFSTDAKEALINYSWPGNVRELKNVISRSYFLCSNSIIQITDLPTNIVNKSISFDQDILSLNYKEAKESVIEKFELQYLSYYLKKNKGNISQTAEDCGIDRRSIHRLINKYNIVFED